MITASYSFDFYEIPDYLSLFLGVLLLTFSKCFKKFDFEGLYYKGYSSDNLTGLSSSLERLRLDWSIGGGDK